MPLVERSQIPLVAMESMNEVHFEEVDLLNALSARLDALPADGKISDAELADIDHRLDDLVLHTREHFASEEEMMIATQFPAYPMHKAEHDRRLEVAAVVVEAWKQTRSIETLKNFIQEDTPAWVVHHIQTMDTITAQYLSPQR